MSCYIVQETDGTSRFTLEDGSGFLVLEDCIPTPGGEYIAVGGRLADAQAQAQAARLAARRREWERRCHMEDDELVCLLMEI